MTPAPRTPTVFALALATLGLAACSSVQGSAIRTGPLQLPAYSGPVAIYALGQPPPGAQDLGVVEVHAAQQEATIDTLLPQFVRKVAQIGGNVAVIDGVRARFQLVGRSYVETYYYTCGFGRTCAGTRMYSANDELMVVSVFGRAFSAQPPIMPELPPTEQPVVPAEATEPSPPTENL